MKRSASEPGLRLKQSEGFFAFPKVIYCLVVVVVDVNLNVVSVTTYVQTLHATRLSSLYNYKTFPFAKP